VRATLLSKIKKIVIICLALIGAFEVATFALPHLFRLVLPVQKSDDFFAKVISSPNGKYKAVVISEAGGGGLSPYCNERIAIAPSIVENSTIELASTYNVYSGVCDTFANHEASPELKWLSDSSLQIAISINTTAMYPRQISLKKMDASKEILVSFLVHE
jgi:hypothetical protein